MQATQPDYVPVAEDIIAAETEYLREVRRTAFASFAGQLLALCDADTPRRFKDLGIDWLAEAMR